MAHHFLSASPVPLLLLVLLLAPLPAKILSIPVSELVAALKFKDVQAGLVGRLFALDGTKDISGVTILVPRSDVIGSAPSGYAKRDNSTRKWNQAVYDALKILRDDASSDTPWTVGQNINAAVAGALSDIWRFQVVKQYIPLSVASQKYSSGGPWELPSLEGQPIWLSYNPSSATWNVSGASPQQMGSSPLPSTYRSGDYGLAGTPFDYSELDAGDLVADIPNGEIAVYKSYAVLLPYNMDALSAYAGATASIVQLLALTALALAALMLV